MSDQLDVVKLLLSRGAAYAAQDVCEQTCLHFAALNVCIECTLWLLDTDIFIGKLPFFEVIDVQVHNCKSE